MANYHLAIDLGASSGRLMLGWLENGKLKLEEMHRFANGVVEKESGFCWDLSSIFREIIAGLKKCKAAGKIPSSIGIDTWGVDFVLLDKNNQILGDSVAYRDSRTDTMDKEVYKVISEAEIYERTGIQKMNFNSLYQLYAIKLKNPEYLEQAVSFLMIPEYLNFLLTGKKLNEYTNASTTNLLSLKTKSWDTELLEKLGIKKEIFGPLHMPGTLVGPLTTSVQEQVGFNSQVYLAASHDTASAVMSVPYMGSDGVFLSSGTWSLIGIENKESNSGAKAHEHNFTNEGGYEYRYRFLKNIMGLWMLQNLRKEFTKKYSFKELNDLAKASSAFPSELNVNDHMFLAPRSMTGAIREYCRKTGQKIPETDGELLYLVYEGLAVCYAKAVKMMEDITGKKFKQINIIGGGCQDQYLNYLTAKMTGLDVFAGPVEGTAIGNLASQLIACGEYRDLTAARENIALSFDVKKIEV